MMTTRYPRIRRMVPGLGRVQLTTDCTTRREHDRRVVLFDELVEAGQLAVVRALVAGETTWAELIEHRRERGSFGVSVLSEVQLRRPLSDAVEQALPRMGAGANQQRYRVTWARLRTHLSGTVSDLETVDWPALRTAWQRSPSDWNHVGRFVSAFLSAYIGKRHPFRTAVVAAFPRAHEAPRVPDLTPRVFWAIVDAAPVHVQASFVTLLLTGLRVRSEYLRCTREHLMPATCQVRVPTNPKTRESVAPVSVERADWPWIERGIPARLQYKWLRIHWCRAAVSAGAARWSDADQETGYRGPTLHSLRHCLAQWATDAGVSVVDVKAQLRHANIATTERYARQSRARQTSKAVSRLIRRRSA